MRLIERLNTPVAVVVVLALFLALNGFLFYRHQQLLATNGNVTTSRPAAGIGPTTVEQANAVEETPAAAAFVHRATPENAVANSTYVDHPLADGNPDAVLSITPSWNPGGGGGRRERHGRLGGVHLSRALSRGWRWSLCRD